MEQTFKIQSFLPGNMTCLMNAQRELMRTSIKAMKRFMAEAPETAKTYDFQTISSLVTQRFIDGSEVTALPDDVYGIAVLSHEEVNKLKHLNLAIIDKNNNAF